MVVETSVLGSGGKRIGPKKRAGCHKTSEQNIYNKFLDIELVDYVIMKLLVLETNITVIMKLLV